MRASGKANALRQQIIEIGQKAVASELVASVGGNLSVRLGDNTFLITETGVALDRIARENILTIDANGVSSNGRKPSKETPMHLSVYRARPMARAVVHLHPVISTTLITIGEKVTPMSFEQLYFVGDRLGIVPPLPAGSMELARAMEEQISTCNIVMLKNHGCITFGGDIYEAYYRVAKLERAALATVISRLYNKPIEPFALL